LVEGKISPVIAACFPILQAADANALLESGGVTGNVVVGSCLEIIPTCRES
jgi:NADPH:quinone reductase-like Zn-dependent oxidoreductase